LRPSQTALKTHLARAQINPVPEQAQALQHRAHVFEHFYRAEPSGVSGSDLGLAIVQEIANQHGTQVRLVSPAVIGVAH
jgi:signal transduction histidine kinase